MDYQIKFNKGFTLVELVVVIGIIAIISSISATVYVNFSAQSHRELAVNSLVQALRYTQSNSQAVFGDSKWGVYIASSTMTVFKGNSYLGRDTASDQITKFSGNVVGSGLNEIIFEKLTGYTLTTGTTTLTNSSGARNVHINDKGIITY